RHGGVPAPVRIGAYLRQPVPPGPRPVQDAVLPGALLDEQVEVKALAVHPGHRAVKSEHRTHLPASTVAGTARCGTGPKVRPTRRTGVPDGPIPHGGTNSQFYC